MTALSVAGAQDLLVDGGFEVSDPGGVYPFSDDWTASWLGESGALVTTTAARSGAHGAWLFTGDGGDDWFTVLGQESAASPGRSYTATAWVRAAPGQPWAEGASVQLRCQFFGAPVEGLGGARILLGSVAGHAGEAALVGWTEIGVTTGAAPPGTESVRLACYLEKPEGAGGQSVANLDDCRLEEVEEPSARVSPLAVGVASGQSSAPVEITNAGGLQLAWEAAVDPGAPWLTVDVASGVVAPGGSAQFEVLVDRGGLVGGDPHSGTLRVTSPRGDARITVYVEGDVAAVPQQPCEARLIGRQLRVRDRLPDGTLSEPYHYVVKGAAWSPASAGLEGSPVNRRAEQSAWALADLGLLREMGANTVRLFLDPGTGAAGREVLDRIYRHGIKALVTVDEEGTGNTANLAAVVQEYRNHPAVLAWLLGNEWNINFYGRKFATLAEAAAATESMAQQIKAIDPARPVISVLGDIDIDTLNPLTIAQEDDPGEVSTERIVNGVCPTVDAWGLNIYRADSFGDLFEQWESVSEKPMLLTEFGTDAYRIRFLDVLDGAEDEVLQAETNRALWDEIATQLSAVSAGNPCLGGTFFSWCDEWWKVKEEHGGALDVQENLGFFGGHPDGFANEEWFGAVTVDRRTRMVYGAMQEGFAAVAPPDDLDGDGMLDAWEYTVIDATAPGGGPGSIFELTAGGDLDGDRVTNLQEFRAGTDALDPASRFAITGFEMTGEGIVIRWIAAPASDQVVERTSAPADPESWVEVFAAPQPTSATGEFLDTAATGSATQFYRVRSTRIEEGG